ncbi:Gfo/Idh/MocA family protein [Bacillus suaedaesalsae]|uniref:Gfo/Idh/MocA family oxidoreductase n=1 Tax=Bacillus suaedaesalsae TaxID=2810349 RepID=A0ABS2DDP4_9BACI|nr:Gfo/Idh/MocA family oxidoreductase [Bacillus suaedaesalsae]MBM6616563.1 Gfo/Idh/MocA family oxidoreductase [Bacillus suaedaesalsae]
MVRFGTIGTNWITDKLLDAAKFVDGFRLTAVYSRSEQTGQEFAEKHGATYVYTDINEMAKSEHIDAIYIASPNSFHHDQAITLMSAGKHVLCEKPFASNFREVKELIECAQNNNVVLMEAMKTTLLPSITAVQENLHKIGKVRKYFASYCKYSSRYDSYKQGTILNAFNPIYSNGSLMDLGVYGIYPMVLLFGKPMDVKATATMLDSGVDGAGSVLALYDGMEGTILHSKISDSYIPSEIQGENGSILIDEISEPGKIEIRYKNGSVEYIKFNQEYPPMYYEVKEFVDLIRIGQLESKVNTYERAKITAEILEETRKQIGLIFPADK